MRSMAAGRMPSGVLAAEFDRGRRGSFCMVGGRRGAAGQGCRLDADARVPEAGGPGGEFFRERVVPVEQEVEQHLLQVAAGEGECGRIGGERGVERDAPVEGVAEQFRISLDDRGRREQGGAHAGPPARREEPGGRSAERRTIRNNLEVLRERRFVFPVRLEQFRLGRAGGGAVFAAWSKRLCQKRWRSVSSPSSARVSPAGGGRARSRHARATGLRETLRQRPSRNSTTPMANGMLSQMARRRRSELGSACTALGYGVMFWTVPKRPSIFPAVSRVACLRTWRIVRRPGWGAIAVSSSSAGPSSRARRAADPLTRRSGAETQPGNSSVLGVPKAGARSWMRQASSGRMSSPVEEMHRPWPTRVNCGASATIARLPVSFQV